MRNNRGNVPKASDKINLDILKKHCSNLDLSNNDNLNFWLYCRISMLTGLRSVDILNMKVSDISFKNGMVRLTEKKTGKKVQAPLSKEVLSQIKKDNEFVIFNDKYKTNVSLMTINRRLKSIYKDSDRNISSHSIRKATATKVYQATGNDIVKAMIFLNHSSPITTKNYLNITNEEKLELYSFLD